MRLILAGYVTLNVNTLLSIYGSLRRAIDDAARLAPGTNQILTRTI